MVLEAHVGGIKIARSLGGLNAICGHEKTLLEKTEKDRCEEAAKKAGSGGENPRGNPDPELRSRPYKNGAKTCFGKPRKVGEKTWSKPPVFVAKNMPRNYL
jgi:hypothetical protein